MIDYQKILDELDIKYWTSGKNNITGCYTIKCPCCDDHSRHGNFNPQTGAYSCWRCKGSHPNVVLAKASGQPLSLINKLVKANGDGVVEVAKKKEYAKTIKIPGGNRPIPKQIEYLKNRGIEPSEAEFLYGIRYGRLGEIIDGIDVSLRIILPIFDEYGTEIAWQARDVTGKSDKRYVFPKAENCLDDGKNHLYGAHLCRDRNRIVVVEGVFDCWKVGSGCVCTFGTSVTPKQIQLMSMWDEVVLAFDNEPEAQIHAKEIAKELATSGTIVYIADTDFGLDSNGEVRDLGDCTKDEILMFRKCVGLD